MENATRRAVAYIAARAATRRDSSSVYGRLGRKTLLVQRDGRFVPGSGVRPLTRGHVGVEGRELDDLVNCSSSRLHVSAVKRDA